MNEPGTNSASFRESQFQGWPVEVDRPPDPNSPFQAEPSGHSSLGACSGSPPTTGNTQHFPPGYTPVNQIHQNGAQWPPGYLRQCQWIQLMEPPVKPPGMLQRILPRRNRMHPPNNRVATEAVILKQFLHTTTGNRSRRSLNRNAGMRDSTTTSGYWRARFFADATGSPRPWPKRRRTTLTQLTPDNHLSSESGPPGLRSK